jgi:serine/threonine protein kinase
LDSTSHRWREITPSEYPWERDALEYVRQGLPDHEPYRAWSNFTFIARDGSLNEVDLLVASPKGVFLVEIKSRPGELTGDAGTWTWIDNGRAYTDDNPLILADKKCKRLKALLESQPAAKKADLPFIAPLVFCSDPNQVNRLPDSARQGVYLRDRDRTPEHGPRRGILWALTQWPDEVDESTRLRRRVDRPMVKAFVRAIDQAGVHPSQRARRVGDYERRELLFEGSGYQDWSGRHVSLPNVERRIRIYTYGSAASGEERETIRRAAQREFQILEGITHRGILRASEFRDLEQGAAVIFERDPGAMRLDLFMRERGARLSTRERCDLLRQIAEALQFAHQRKITHRALSPQSILVRAPDGPAPEIQIYNWQTGARELQSSGQTRERFTATSHLEQLIEDASTIYVAPEALTSGWATGEQLDVFSLGAVAYFLFTGRPPASGAAELLQTLRAGNGLQLSATIDGAPRKLQELVQYATAPVTDDRLESIADFLELQDDAERELAMPTQESIADPVDARAGDSLGQGINVKQRLGRGSTAVAFLVENESAEQVLKLALDPRHNDRLRGEAEVLAKLRDRHVVELLGTVEIGERVGLLMARAGDSTLAQRIRKDGRLDLELLERFGEQLLQTVDFLEQKGISHRDIKPENIGVRPSGRGSRLELVLFDFSLSRTPLDEIRAGTPPYLDPFLAERQPARWDGYAERFAAAMTLHEMATGTLPVWGDGRSNPAVLDCEVTLDPELFDASVREALSAFFAKALRREHAGRFDNAEEMLDAWRDVFASAEKAEQLGGAAIVTESHAEAAEPAGFRLDGADRTTPLAAVGLSNRALNALERRAAQTVGDLLRLTMAQITTTPGIGTKTRREIGALLRELRLLAPVAAHDARIGERVAPDDSTSPDISRCSIDRLATSLLPARVIRRDEPSRAQTAIFLGLESPPTGGALPPWASQTDVAKALDLTRARIGQVIARARERWAKQPDLNHLRDDLAKLLLEHGGVMTADELVAAVLALRGSAEEEPRRSLLARAVTRAAVEAERVRATPRWITCRRGEHFFVALDEPGAGLDGERLADYAEQLGRRADELAASYPLPAPSRVIEALRLIRPPVNAPTLSDDRLLRLAAAASDTAAVSSRQELYPRGMPPERALKLAQGALLGARDLTVEQLRQRVLGRYPLAAPLPDRPALDSLVGSLAADLSWEPAAAEGRGAYRLRAVEVGQVTTAATTLGRYPTDLSEAPERDPEKDEADDFEERIKRKVAHGGFLALSTTPGRAERVACEIAKRFTVDVHDLDELMIRHMKEATAAANARWDVVVETDAAGPQSSNWGRLLTLVARALPKAEAEVRASKRPVLLRHPGLLARFDKLDLLERLRDAAGRENELPGLIVLIATDEQSAMPMIDGKPVPVITRGQWARVPESWIANRHRAGLEQRGNKTAEASG